MTTASPERVLPDVEPVTFTEFEFDVVCDISALKHDGLGWPQCQGEPARWVA
jgi:hypothetical protein